MTTEKLEVNIREWEKTFEKLLIEMTSVTTEDGKAMFFDGIPLLKEFETAVYRLKSDHYWSRVCDE